MSAKERGDQNAVVDALRSIQPAVFIPASVVIVAMIVVSVVYSSVAENAFVRLNSAITGGVGWWYILVATGFVVFARARARRAGRPPALRTHRCRVD